MIGRSVIGRGRAGVAAVMTAVFLAACSHPAPQVLEPPSPSGTPYTEDVSPTPDATPSAQASPSSAQPSKKPSPKSSKAPVKDLDYYIDRLPKFGPEITPEPQDVDAGDSAPLWFKVPTAQPVAFLTIDDGALRHPMALPLLKASGIRVTLFLTLNYVEKYPDYFKALQDAGAVIENHTITHTSLKGKSYEFQKHEICYTADRFAQLFGRRPTLFRPPYGDYDATTLKVARECGQKVAFYWSETVDKGIVRYQTSNHTIQPGHILLMHFRPAFGDDFTAALIRMKASGVRPGLLEDYVKGACENSCRP